MALLSRPINCSPELNLAASVYYITITPKLARGFLGKFAGKRAVSRGANVRFALRGGMTTRALAVSPLRIKAGLCPMRVRV
jgi:hypothetical protein